MIMSKSVPKSRRALKKLSLRSLKKTVSRKDARHVILAAVNARRPPSLYLLQMRHIEEAVCIARHWDLVPGIFLKAAGFNTISRRYK